MCISLHNIAEIGKEIKKILNIIKLSILLIPEWHIRSTTTYSPIYNYIFTQSILIVLMQLINIIFNVSRHARPVLYPDIQYTYSLCPVSGEPKPAMNILLPFYFRSQSRENLSNAYMYSSNCQLF